MLQPKRINSPALLVALLGLGLQSCTQTPANRIERAKQIMRSHVASTVTVRFEPGSEKLSEPPGGFYYLCARGIVNNPGLTDNQSQRIIIHVNKEIDDGIALFDGSSDPKAKAEFQANWEKKCG